MDIETITKLVNAGYTKAEIDAMAGEPESAGAGETAGADIESAGKEPSNAGAENESEIKGDEISDVVKSLTESVKGLEATVKAMQEKNAGTASTEKPDKNTVDDVMKSFIDSL